MIVRLLLIPLSWLVWSSILWKTYDRSYKVLTTNVVKGFSYAGNLRDIFINMIKLKFTHGLLTAISISMLNILKFVLLISSHWNYEHIFNKGESFVCHPVITHFSLQPNYTTAPRQWTKLMPKSAFWIAKIKLPGRK